jgi:hypothetical protein
VSGWSISKKIFSSEIISQKYHANSSGEFVGFFCFKENQRKEIGDV